MKVYISSFYFGDTYIFIIFETGRMENLSREIQQDRCYQSKEFNHRFT